MVYMAFEFSDRLSLIEHGYVLVKRGKLEIQV